MLDPRKTAFTVLMVLLQLPSAAVTQSQSPTRSSTKHATEEPDESAKWCDRSNEEDVALGPQS